VGDHDRDRRAERGHRGGARHQWAWGSNWLGPFSLEQRMDMLRRQHAMWSAADVRVTAVWIGDPMAWNTPDDVVEQLETIQREWPDIARFHLHLHNARGSALVSAYAAIKALQPQHTLVLDTSIGGIGGCPYGGHGRLTRMIPTEDAVDLLNEMGIETGVDLELLIEAAVCAEEIIGHRLYGHVSGAGPRPRGERLFPMDMPLVETEAQAQHFRLGPAAYEGSSRPWRQPISSPARTALRLASDQ